jgi:hypothetical protein
VQIRFYIDPETGRAHCEAHDVRPTEAAEVLQRRSQDFAARDGARMAMGTTKAGRVLRVVYVLDEDGSVFVITAYPLTGGALRAFKKRQRRRDR